MRKWMAETHGNLPKQPLPKRIRSVADIQLTEVPVTYGIDNSFSIRTYVPMIPPDEAISKPALIMFHGGGWFAGSAEGDDNIAEFFASELRAVVFSVDYRLSPEFPFPQSYNDCYKALNWVISNASTYNVNTDRIGVYGISSSANLAASIAHQDYAKNKFPRIRHLNLVVPVTCHPKYYLPVLRSKEGSGWKFFPDTLDPYNSGLRIWEKFADDSFKGDPYGSPLLAEVPPIFPSVHITVASCDGLRDEGIAHALELRDGGVDAQLEIVPGAPHGLTLSPTTHVAKQFYRNQARVLNIALNTEF